MAWPETPYSILLLSEPDGSPRGWYVNLQTPLKRTLIGFDTVDHLLDVLIPMVRAGTALRLPLPLDAEELRSSARWWFYTAAKARDQLGFMTRPLDDSIRDTANWLKADGYHHH